MYFYEWKQDMRRGSCALTLKLMHPHPHVRINPSTHTQPCIHTTRALAYTPVHMCRVTHNCTYTLMLSYTLAPSHTYTCICFPSSSPMTRSHLWLSWSPLHVWTSRLQAISHGTPSAPGGDTEDPCDSSVLKWLCEPCYKKMKADNRWGHHSGGQPHFHTGGQSHLLESLPSQHLFEIILC